MVRQPSTQSLTAEKEKILDLQLRLVVVSKSPDLTLRILLVLIMWIPHSYGVLCLMGIPVPAHQQEAEVISPAMVQKERSSIGNIASFLRPVFPLQAIREN